MSAEFLPRCAVIVSTRGRTLETRRCLAGLAAAAPAQWCEPFVIVVETSEAKAPGPLRGADLVVAGPEGVAALNAGAQAAGECEYLAFVDCASVVAPGWLDALVESAQTGASAVGALVLQPNGWVKQAGIVIDQDRWPRDLYSHLPAEHPAVSRTKRVRAVGDTCILVDANRFHALGAFDIALSARFAAIDLCLRLGEAGDTVHFCPAASVQYLAAAQPTGAERRLEGESKSIYGERWRERVAPDDIEHYLDDGLLRFGYTEHYPVAVSVSPYLALPAEPEGLARILEERARASEHIGRLAPTPAERRARSEPQVLASGTTHRLGAGHAEHVISVLMPVKNAGPSLRATLDAVVGQSTDALLEIVAVDSGSQDETIDVLREFDAKVIAIDPADFDHGLTRNLAAEHARGDVLVFLNQRSLPADSAWLAPLVAALDRDPYVAGACSRMVPHDDADPLIVKDVLGEVSGAPVREHKQITDWEAYRALGVEERRAFLNFHTASAAVRTEVFARIPLRSVRTLGEDLLWAKEVLEGGLALVHEPASVCHHSHAYDLPEWFSRNFDDGWANHEIVGRVLPSGRVVGMIESLVRDDWIYLRERLGLTGAELERWQLEAALRRAAQVLGQWLGVNADELPDELIERVSLTARTRAGSA